MKVIILFTFLFNLALNLSGYAQQNNLQVYVEVRGAKADTLQAAEQHKRNMIDFELAGNAFFYSIGYTYSVKPDWGIRIGFGYLDFPEVDDNRDENEPRSYFRIMNIPVTASYYKKRVEFIAGLRFDKLESQFGIFETSRWNRWHITPTAGAGYWYSAKQFVFGAKITVSYVTYLSDLPSVLPGAGIKFGYNF